MKALKHSAAAVSLTFILAACGGDAETGDDGSATVGSGPAGGPQSSMTLADNGPAVCFEAVAAKLGADTKVSSITTGFAVGDNLEKYTVVSTERGILKSCTVKYQDPENANKLVQVDMDVATGEFGDPQPLEISVIGNAADFKLENILIPVSSINSAAIAAKVDAQKARLDEAFSEHALQRVSLSSPGPGSAVHGIDVSFAGRLKSNDILETAGFGLNVDGSDDYNNIGN